MVKNQVLRFRHGISCRRQNIGVWRCFQRRRCRNLLKFLFSAGLTPQVFSPADHIAFCSKIPFTRSLQDQFKLEVKHLGQGYADMWTAGDRELSFQLVDKTKHLERCHSRCDQPTATSVNAAKWNFISRLTVVDSEYFFF